MISNHKNKFIMRLHTAATEALTANSQSTWSIQRDLGVLIRTAITEIKDPLPAAKTKTVDAAGMNGAIDATEALGQVFYKNKTVTVTVQKQADRLELWKDMRDYFARMHGRLVDFAFDDASSVEWYYTGRLSVENEDEPSGKLTLKIDAYPFLQSVVKRSYNIPTATLLDRGSNGWSVSSKPSTATVVLNDGQILIFGNPGDKVTLRRSASNANRYTFAPLNFYGGEYQFSNGSRTLGVPSGGYLYLELTIDGSAYDRQTVSGVKVYKPCLYLNYLLTQLSTSGSIVTGEDGNVNTNPRCAIVLRSNKRVRPEITNGNTAAAIVLLDGEGIEIPANSATKLFPGAVLPGIRADQSDVYTTCYLSAVGASASDNPSITISYREERLAL